MQVLIVAQSFKAQFTIQLNFYFSLFPFFLIVSLVTNFTVSLIKGLPETFLPFFFFLQNHIFVLYIFEYLHIFVLYMFE